MEQLEGNISKILQDFGEGKDSERLTFLAIKGKHWQMEPHKIKFLYSNKNNQSSEETRTPVTR